MRLHITVHLFTCLTSREYRGILKKSIFFCSWEGKGKKKTQLATAFISSIASWPKPSRYKISVKLSPFSRVGASSCTLLLARQATPNPASCNMSKSLAPSPTAIVCLMGILLSAASFCRRVLFWAASMMGKVGTRLPVRVWVVSSISSCFVFSKKI
jgi:hypothetical protein